ncbi:hypothetical protein [Paenibacillus polymyxa]|uniref:hypothetical protein n=1 Tax=Paenibacillus polymyxa TaxID=1406 RepID=UPI00234AB2A4|nr:hypothetical protein [Paenibacillus polymyxa]WCM60296.1 hypothetical protein OYT09_20295 [Paenibacillus polymyxa]
MDSKIRMKNVEDKLYTLLVDIEVTLRSKIRIDFQILLEVTSSLDELIKLSEDYHLKKKIIYYLLGTHSYIISEISYSDSERRTRLKKFLEKFEEIIESFLKSLVVKSNIGQGYDKAKLNKILIQLNNYQEIIKKNNKFTDTEFLNLFDLLEMVTHLNINKDSIDIVLVYTLFSLWKLIIRKSDYLERLIAYNENDSELFNYFNILNLIEKNVEIR